MRRFFTLRGASGSKRLAAFAAAFASVGDPVPVGAVLLSLQRM